MTTPEEFERAKVRENIAKMIFMTYYAHQPFQKEFIKACLDIADQILAIPNLAILHPEQNHPLVTNPQEVDIATAYAHRMYKQGFRRVIL